MQFWPFLYTEAVESNFDNIFSKLYTFLEFRVDFKKLIRFYLSSLLKTTKVGS